MHYHLTQYIRIELTADRWKMIASSLAKGSILVVAIAELVDYRWGY
jgi:hypothetical protein